MCVEVVESGRGMEEDIVALPFFPFFLISFLERSGEES